MMNKKLSKQKTVMAFVTAELSGKNELQKHLNTKSFLEWHE